MRCWATGSNAGFDGRPASGLDRDRVKAVLAPAGRCPDEFGRARQAIIAGMAVRMGCRNRNRSCPPGLPHQPDSDGGGPALLNSALCVLYTKLK